VKQLTVHLDGTLRFLPGRPGWPVHHQCDRWWNPLQPTPGKTCVAEAFFIANVSDLTLSSNGTGTLDGSGDAWWGYVQYLIHGENRPRLLSLLNATGVLVEHWRFLQSPYWTFTARDVAGLEIRHCAINNRVNSADSHGPLNLAAFNTDGFDVAGRDIYIHHSTVWNQDDCFTIQPMDRSGVNAQCTENILIEDVNASGLGLTVGAVRPSLNHSCVRNVTFRRARMHHTFKGIYMKSQWSDQPGATAEISNVLYEDIQMDGPTQVRAQPPVYPGYPSWQSCNVRSFPEKNAVVFRFCFGDRATSVPCPTRLPCGARDHGTWSKLKGPPANDLPNNVACSPPH
jgi:polygalacturonase